MFFYNDIERIKIINKALSDRAFFLSIGYDYEEIPEKLKELSLPVASPHFLIRRDYKSILDIGCGAGTDIYLISKRIMSSTIVGVDISLPLLKEGQKVHNLSVANANAQYLPFKNDTFDLVIMNGTFNQINEKISFLSELRRVMKENGHLIISDVFKKDDIIEVEEGMAFNINSAFSKVDLLSFFDKADFELLDSFFNEDFTKEFGVFSCLWKVL